MLCGLQGSRRETKERMLFQPSELLVCTNLVGGKGGMHLYWINMDDVIFPAPLLVFIIIPGPLWRSTKTICIDSGEAYLRLIHCLYIGPQSHPSANKQ